MRPSPFQYHKARDLLEALALLGNLGEDARPLAGGQSLVPMMNLRLARPAHLVDISALPLDSIDIKGRVVRIGALVRHQRYLSDPAIARHLPVLAEAVHSIGHPTIRRHGTLGGSIAHADPTAELPAMCVLHEAEIILNSLEGERRVAAGDFFRGAYVTDVRPGEMIVAVEFPLPARPRNGAFVEFAERRGDFALASAGVLLDCTAGRIDAASVVCCGAMMMPVRLFEIEKALVGAPVDTLDITAAVRPIASALQPISDHVASADFRRALILDVLRRAITTACRRAGEVL